MDHPQWKGRRSTMLLLATLNYLAAFAMAGHEYSTSRNKKVPSPSKYNQNIPISLNSPAEALQKVTSLNHRNVQEQQPNYFADYVGRFQYERNSLCFGGLPEVRATCRGTIEFQRVSNDEFIVCDDVVANADETTSITCRSTCNPIQCREVFLSTSFAGLTEGPYGELYFRCSGETILEAEASFAYLETGMSGCAAFAQPSTRHFHIAQLGVLCEDEYSFNGFFFECNTDSGFVDIVKAPDGSPIYTCVNGENCRGVECEIVFKDIVIDAEIMNFQESCVSSPNGLALSSSPTPPPFERRRKLVSEFIFNFGVDFPDGGGLTCGIEYPTVTIRCTNGEIAFVESSLGINPCDRVDDQTLVCSSIQDELLLGIVGSVTYSCSSSQSPMTVAEVSETRASCPELRQFGELGVFCSAGRNPSFVFIDPIFECGDEDTLWVLETDGNRINCASNTSSTTDLELSAVSVGTGHFWRAEPFIGNCARAVTPASTTAPSMTAIEENESEAVDKVVIIVAAVAAAALLILCAIFYMICRNKNKEDSGIITQSHKAVSFEQSETTGYNGHPEEGSGGPPAPLAYDYGMPGHSYDENGRQTMSGGGNGNVQLANVISVDGPIAFADPIPHMYFPRADATSASNDDGGVRFKDQSSEEPSSRVRHSDTRSASLGSSHEGSKPPPYLQQKIDSMSSRGDAAIGSNVSGGESSGPGEVLPSQRMANQDFTADRLNSENSQYKDQEAQSVIGEVQAVNGLPFYYPGVRSSLPSGQDAQHLPEQSMLPVSNDGSSADPSMLPIDGMTEGSNNVEEEDPNESMLSI